MEQRYLPQRRCTACRNAFPKEQLIRVAVSGGTLKVDPKGILPGRGAYVCRNEKCISTAAEKNCFSRSFKMGFSKANLKELREELMKNIL